MKTETFHARSLQGVMESLAKGVNPTSSSIDELFDQVTLITGKTYGKKDFAKAAKDLRHWCVAEAEVSRVIK